MIKRMTTDRIYYYTKQQQLNFDKKVNEVKTHLNQIDWNYLKKPE